MLVFFYSFFCYSAVFPNECSISLVALGDTQDWDAKIRFWDNVYGR